MGCDIHLYLEHRAHDQSIEYWSAFGGRLNPGRDYDLFTKLAGVRAGGEEGQMLPIRGLPERTSLPTKWDNEKYVSDSPDGESCSREDAERWIALGCSQWVDDRKVSVTNPDWHTHSHCSLSEFRSVVEAPRDWPVEVEYWAVLAAADELHKRGRKVRFVFWFDN